MTPEHWQQVDQLFQAAIELPPEERKSFLVQACAGNESLRSQVEALLASDEHGLSFIEEPAFEMAANLLVSGKPGLAKGHRLGDYKILDLLGKGGMGEVYLAEDTGLGRKIAIKLLPAEFTRDKDRLQRFRQEARAASALNHPNILTIHQIAQADGRHFIATEFIDGETLRQRMKRSQLSFGETIEIAAQVGSALAAAHEAGIVHRDIKPDNIMLRRDGYVKVLDFGLAKLSEHGGTTQKEAYAIKETARQARAAESLNISSGLVMGTVKYMSPEQARGEQVDQRSDIFSFGVVLYEMLAGRTPFEGESASELITSLLRKEPPPLSDVPIEMQLIVSRALRRKREERYPTIKSLLIELRELADPKALAITGRIAQPADTSELSTIAIAPLSTASRIESIVTGIKRHKTSATFVLASLVLVALGMTFGLRRFFRQRTPSNQMRITRLPNLDKAETVAISPDGRYIAQAAAISGKYGIWLVDVANGNNQPVIMLPGDNFLTDLTFSRDGERIFYVYGPVLYQVSVRGGDAVKMLDGINSPIAIAPDEKQVAFTKMSDSDQQIELIVANVDGSGQQVLGSRKKPEFLGLPAWSPDGKVIACSVGLNASNQKESLTSFEVATGQEKRITAQCWQGIVRMVWLQDGSGLIATASETRAQNAQIWQISYSDGDARRITNDLDNYGDLSLTADRHSLLTIQGAQRSSIWVMPREDPKSAKPITVSERVSYRVVSFTPDGRILYPSDIGDGQDIWIMNADGTNARQLTANAGANIQVKASPDGRYIVFTSNRANKGAFNVWRMNIDGTNPIQLTEGEGETGPCVTPDGLWVVYAKGGPEVNAAEKTLWKVPIDGGEPVQLTNSSSAGAAISPDGSTIACWYRQNAGSPWQLALIPASGGAPIRTFDVPGSITIWPRWTPDGLEVSYVGRGAASNIWSQPISGGPPKQVTQFTSERIDGFDWSRDGTLVCSRQHSTQDVLLITDFR